VHVRPRRRRRENTIFYLGEPLFAAAFRSIALAPLRIPNNP
jgi:hypothetical protein